MKQRKRIRIGGEYAGNIASVRAIEDCVRESKKYTEYIQTVRAKHPIQGESIPCRMVNKYYEVYPLIKHPISWDMPAGQAIDLAWGDTDIVDICFVYDYRSNKAWFRVQGGDRSIKLLSKGIQGFSDSLAGMNGRTKTT